MIKLSKFDRKFLNGAEKSFIKNCKRNYLYNKANYHYQAEIIRAKHGYSGGIDGMQYIT
jgi:hypothetical protein